MKIYKKIRTALLLLLVLSAAVFIFTPKHALAAGNKDDVVQCFNSLEFIDIAHISCNLGGSQVVFTDVQPDDDTTEYAAESGKFCDYGKSNKLIIFNQSQKLRHGDIGDTNISASLHVGKIPNGGGAGCSEFIGTNDSPDHKTFKAVTNADNVAIVMQGGNDTVLPLSGVSKGLMATNYSRDSKYDPNGSVHIFSNGYDPAKCSGSILAVSNKGAAAIEYEIKAGSGGGFSKFPEVFAKFPKTTGCDVNDRNLGFGGSFTISPAATISNDPTAGAGIKKGDSCTSGTDCDTNGTCKVDGGDCFGGASAEASGACADLQTCLQNGADDSSACAANGHTSLEWLACPITGAISKFGDAINGFVEDQLNFNVDELLSNNCTNNKCPIKQAWGIIKNIVSALVVVLMLVMVLSQAIGGQMFDAYTVRKMLPRLVIAVILMQFSWVLGRYLVEVANDLGEGIRQIMLAPFGGAGNMDLNSILHHLNPEYAVGTNLVTIPAISGLAIAMIFTGTAAADFISAVLIFVVVAVVSALLVALATLLFRNIIIIAAIIFAPLALLLWATPSQTAQGYWKKYVDNFSKALLFFPLAMLIIYLGRIVAWLAGGLGEPGLIDYMIVIVAFFLPYYMLPKAFRWGGQALSTVNQGLNNNRITQSGKKWGYQNAKSSHEEAKGEAAKAYGDLKERRFNPYGRLGRTLGVVGARGLIAKRQPGGGWTGKRAPVDRRRVGMWKAGYVLESQTNRKKVAAQSKAWKGSTDESWEEANKKIGEEQRSGLSGAIRFFMKDGKPAAQAFEKGKKNRSWTRYFAGMVQTLNSKDKRRGEGAAQTMAGQGGKSGIHIGNGLIQYDPDGAMDEIYASIATKNGLNPIGYNDKKLQPGEAGLKAELDGLQIRKDRADKLQKRVDKGETLDAAEQAELDGWNTNGRDKFRHDELDTLFTLHYADLPKLTKADRGYVKDKMDWLNDARPGAIRKFDDATATKDEVEAGADYEGSFWGDIDPYTGKEREHKVRLARILDDQTFQTKGTSHEPTAQFITSVSPWDNPDVKAYFEDSGYKYEYDPNADIGEEHRIYNEADELLYAFGDHTMAQTVASMNESAESNFVQLSKTAKATRDFGHVGHDKQGNPALLRADRYAKWFFDNLTELDPQTQQVLTHKISLPSHRELFNENLANTTTPADIIKLALPNIALHPHKEEFEKAAFHEVMHMRRELGIKDHDSRPITDRDLRKYRDLTMLRQWYPSVTMETVTKVYDNIKDPDNAPKEVPYDMDKLPADWMPARRDPPNPKIVAEVSGELRGMPGVGEMPEGMPAMPTMMGGATVGPGITSLPRWQMAQMALNEMGYRGDDGRPVTLNRVQQNAVQEAHEVGTGPVGAYTPAEIAEKGRILGEAGFTDDQTRVIIERGIAGHSADDSGDPADNQLKLHVQSVVEAAVKSGDMGSLATLLDDLGSIDVTPQVNLDTTAAAQAIGSLNAQTAASAQPLVMPMPQAPAGNLFPAPAAAPAPAPSAAAPAPAPQAQQQSQLGGSIRSNSDSGVLQVSHSAAAPSWHPDPKTAQDEMRHAFQDAFAPLQKELHEIGAKTSASETGTRAADNLSRRGPRITPPK